MGRILVLVIGFAVTAVIVYAYLQRSGVEVPGGAVEGVHSGATSAPKETLDNVREAKKRIEREAQQRLDNALKDQP